MEIKKFLEEHEDEQNRDGVKNERTQSAKEQNAGELVKHVALSNADEN